MINDIGIISSVSIDSYQDLHAIDMFAGEASVHQGFRWDLRSTQKYH